MENVFRSPFPGRASPFDLKGADVPFRYLFVSHSSRFGGGDADQKAE